MTKNTSKKASNNQGEFDIAEPQATSLAESLRAFSYELPTALADLVDNSITAKARHVWIDFFWDGESSTIAVTDDGDGMTTEKLVSAMRLGSQSPMEQRESHDLGRFGLGLKTASFSQCRRVTVRSRTSSTSSATRCWDLDHLAKVNEWQLLRSADAAAEVFFSRLEKLRHGTTVLWQKIDRITAGFETDNERHQQLFLHNAEEVRRHLAMVFHLFMVGKKPVEIILNDRVIVPWDPFLSNEPATQTLATTELSLHGEKVEVRPYILPHQSKITKKTHEAASGPYGWNAHQGFYVYRNRRLLVPGTWLGFGWAKEEHYKLARILVEIPNALDHDWQIDVTKSRAAPPPQLRDELRHIAERTRSEAKRIYSHRGAKLAKVADNNRVLLWEPMARHDKTFYRLNREHPLLKRSLAVSADKAALNALLRLIEETIPFPHITITNSEKPETLPAPFDHTAESQISEVMQQAFRSLVDSGYDAKDAVNRLKTLWPFELFPALLESLAESAPNA